MNYISHVDPSARTALSLHPNRKMRTLLTRIASLLVIDAVISTSNRYNLDQILFGKRHTLSLVSYALVLACKINRLFVLSQQTIKVSIDLEILFISSISTR